jgi:hypothetical protein
MDSQLKTPWRYLLYGFSGLLVVITIFIYIEFLPAYYQNEITFATEFYNQHLIRLNPNTYGLITTGRDILVTFSFWLVAGNLAWRNWRNPFVIFLPLLWC